MTPIAFLILFATGVIGYVLNLRAARAIRAGGIPMHSLDGFRGGYAALTVLIPTCFSIVPWLPFPGTVIEMPVKAGLPLGQLDGLGADEIRLITAEIRSIAGGRVFGETALDGQAIPAPSVDPVQLRAKVGTVLLKPTPFPKSIYDNAAYGPEICGMPRNKAELDEVMERSLRGAGRWDEVTVRLDTPGTGLSGGQQQRLCIARPLPSPPGARQRAA